MIIVYDKTQPYENSAQVFKSISNHHQDFLTQGEHSLDTSNNPSNVEIKCDAQLLLMLMCLLHSLS